MSAPTAAAVLLAFAAGTSMGFTLGRLFERMEWTKKGWRKD
jgi:ABC-type nitrate/sulfonate/bicarbonate transport system permease component